MRFRCIVLLSLVLCSSLQAVDLRLHRFYTDDMVVQRDKAVPVRGWTEPGAEVKVSFAGQSKATTADKAGAWTVTLAPMTANAEGQDLTCVSAGDQVVLRNVVIGDVLILARQSSIETSLRATEDGKALASGVKPDPNLRRMVIRTTPAKAPKTDLSEDATSGWAQVSRDSVMSMSAVALHLGEELAGKLDVPLGMVDIHMGPHFAIGWLSSRGLDESTARYPECFDVDWFRKHMPAKVDERDSGEMARRAEAIMKQHKSSRPPSLGLHPLEQPYYPSAGYNAVIHPLRGIAVKAILLQLGNDYQLIPYAKLRADGKITDPVELSRAWPQSYGIIKNGNRITHGTLPLVPGDLRRSFGEELPIAMILPPGSDFYDYAGHNREIRELLRRTQQDVEGLGLIMPGTRHVALSGQPAEDRLLANRCAKWVLGSVYKKDGVIASGPVFSHIESAPGEVDVYFEEGTAEGLTTGGAALETFEVAGADKAFVSCSARIDGNMIRLKSDDVPYAQFVRYNWSLKPDQGLVNSAGLPVLPFTSDPDWTYDWWPDSAPAVYPPEFNTPASTWSKSDVKIVNGSLADGNSGDSEPQPTLIGPTGLRTDPFGPNLYVHSAEPGSPAHGKVQPGDVIFSVNGEAFGDDMYRELANAITWSESEAGKGEMTLGIRRQGKLISVELQLEVMGSYSGTTPYYCPKSEKIVSQAEDWLARRARPGSGMASDVAGAHGTDLWFLLASGNPKHQGLVRRAIYASMSKPPSTPDPNQNAIPWHIGYRAILLGEYYNSTGDTNVLPYLESQAGWAAVTQLRPQSEPGPQEAAYTEQQVGGYRSRYAPNRPMVTSGYGLMSAAGMPCVMGMVLAKESGVKVDETALARGLKHFYHRRAEYGDVIYWYHPLWRDGPRPINPEAEANGKLWSMNGKLGTAAALFKMAGYPTAVDACARFCVYGYNNTRHGHGGMFYNNLWTPIGAHIAGERGFKHFMKGQTWWRELYRRHDGSFNQVGRGGVGVSYAIHYVAPKKRLRILDAPKSAFGTNCPQYLQPALAAHRNRAYGESERLIQGVIKQGIVAAEELPVVEHMLDSVQTLMASIEYDLTYTEGLIEQGKYYHASIELPQLKGVVAADSPRLQRLVKTLESDEGRTRIAAAKNELDTEARAKRASKPKGPAAKENWVCLITQAGSDKHSPLGAVPSTEASRWRMKVLETRDHAPKGWADPQFDDTGWDEMKLPISWRVSHDALFRTTFTVDDKKAYDALRIRGGFGKQRNVEIYINGKLVAKANNNGNMVQAELTDYALKVTRKGENTLALVTTHLKRWGKVKGDFSGATGMGFRLDAKKIE